ncbi:hypothetical protein T01_15432 [Trichinella spiralis]|uniref:Uncharacterized protein n=1 Tax=Trichinella spiralis TaxID=6334 RepID=A0A0V0Z0H3_TRISP|nr:hypothetical protein T01_15432 [Trichinella spiralis]
MFFFLHDMVYLSLLAVQVRSIVLVLYYQNQVWIWAIIKAHYVANYVLE